MSGRHTAVLYTRAGCGLCAQAEGWLREVAGELGLAVEVVDIESDEELLRRYLIEIPVVAVDGREVAWAPIRSKGALREAIEGAVSASPAESGEGVGG